MLNSRLIVRRGVMLGRILEARPRLLQGGHALLVGLFVAAQQPLDLLVGALEGRIGLASLGRESGRFGFGRLAELLLRLLALLVGSVYLFVCLFSLKLLVTLGFFFRFLLLLLFQKLVEL